MGLRHLTLIFRHFLGDRNQQKVVDKSLKRRIYVDAQDDSFVQCVSPTRACLYYSLSLSVSDTTVFLFLLSPRIELMVYFDNQ